MRAQFCFVRVHCLLICWTCVFGSLDNVLILLCIIFLTHIYVLSQLCSHCGWLLLKCSAVRIGFNGAETNCGIAHTLGILLMNSYNTDIFFSNYYNLQSVHFEYKRKNRGTKAEHENPQKTSRWKYPRTRQWCNPWGLRVC